MNAANKRDIRELLRAITNPELLSRTPVLVIILLTSLVHLITSIDLGFRNLEIRAPIAVFSIIPAFLFVWIAHKLSRDREVLRFILVPLAYLLGGAVRGLILGRLLEVAEILQGDFQYFRIYAGTTIVAFNFILVSYTLSTIQQAASDINELQIQTEKLSEALKKVREETEVADRAQVSLIQEKISGELFKATQVGPSNMRNNLERLINEVVRPLSQDFARDVRNWQPPSTEKVQLTPRAFWSYIDPVRHLRIPVVGISSMIIAAIGSLLAFFDVRDAIEVVIGVSLSLLLSSYLVFKVVGRFFRNLRPPLRDLLLTASFVVLLLPAVAIQRWALEGTENPDIYVVSTLIITPLFAWVILIGSAALGLSRDSTQRLLDIRNELQWAIARINLLTWYRRGLISRILHGPVQNSIQVAILRMKSADDNQSMEIANEVITRIDRSLKEVLDPKTSPELELQTLESINETWRSVAEISIDISQQCRDALRSDLAASSIVTDLIQEICSNSIRHGKADQIAINARAKEGSIEVSIVDNGITRSTNVSVTGLGTQFLDACTIEWQGKKVDGRNTLTLSVPTTFSHSLTAAAI